MHKAHNIRFKPVFVFLIYVVWKIREYKFKKYSPQYQYQISKKISSEIKEAPIGIELTKLFQNHILT